MALKWLLFLGVVSFALTPGEARAKSPEGAGPATTTLWANGSVIEFSGEITMDSSAEFIRLAELHRPQRLVITSGGGAVLAGLDMADYVHSHGMDVEVPTACFSSCANYVFPAARNKVIQGSGLVGWHGTIAHLLHLHDLGKQKIPDEVMHQVESMANRERAFFRKIGVDDFMPWFAKLPPYNVYNTYLLSIEDMARFGVHHVSAPEGYASTDLSAWNTADRVNMVFVQVDWPTLNAFRPSRAGIPAPAPESSPSTGQ